MFSFGWLLSPAGWVESGDMQKLKGWLRLVGVFGFGRCRGRADAIVSDRWLTV
jgi:hypothetical protein